MKINKKAACLPVLLLFFVFNIYAQVSFAPKIGLSYSKLGGDLTNVRFMPGAFFGGITNFKLHTFYSLQTGILLSGKGTTLKFSEVDDDQILITYLEFPLNSVLMIPAGSGYMQLFAGPYMGLAINARYKYLEDDNDMMEKMLIGTSTDDEIRPSDLGVSFGLGYLYEGLEMQLTYSRSLSNVSNVANETLKHNVITASIAYFFGYDSRNYRYQRRRR